MSTPEERLAALLRDTDVPVRGDGLQQIQAKLARRRRTRWIAPVAALATAGAAASALVLTGAGDRDTLTVQPGDTPSVTAEPSATSDCPAVPGQDPCAHSNPPLPTTYSYDGPFIWPAPQTSLDVEAWRSDPQQVVEHFVTDFLKLDGITVIPQATSAPPGQGQDELLRVNGTAIALVTVEPMQQGKTWVVTQSNGFGGNLTAPGFGESVTSPLDVRGTLDQAVDDNVRLTLLTQAGKEIAQTSAPAGSAVPWSGTLTWTDTSWTSGAVVGVTRSLKDGAVTRIFAQPVVRATGADVATFVGIVDGHVSTFATDGSIGRQLTYPPSGSRDVEASFNGTSALVVRQANGSGCGRRLIRIDGTRASTVSTSTTADIRTPRLSDDGVQSAWIEQPCDGSPSRLMVLSSSGAPHAVAVPRDYSARVQDVRDDGAAIVDVSTGDTLGQFLVTSGNKTVLDGRRLDPSTSCELGAPAFDGPRIAAWETCSGKVHAVRFDGNGARVTVDPDVPLSALPQRTSVNSGRVLVWLAGGDTVGEIARYQDGKLTTVVRNAGCTSVSEPKGCVRDPSW